ncbi:DUF881 domain-containing protein [Bacillus massilinigeriensis]|uniref:DUF881 domain-containing protein n=1 Tax=Bacillus mediterraneensis TaxID=1805474 RepID=UPI0008F954B1|nr:DUF881 domain-containing protein [Bacillus mediterraneensis]
MLKNSSSNRVVLSLVCLILGFMFAFSYRLTQEEKAKPHISDRQWEHNLDLRNELIKEEKENSALQKKLAGYQETISKKEKGLAKEAEVFFNLAEDAEKYRLFLGKVAVQGSGVTVTLSDGAYNSKEDNINNYLVHEHHIFKVVNELYIAGASAITINGQRLAHNSYIICNGPVITIDGYQHPAPFEIAAIGKAEVLDSALNIPGGVRDQLVSDNVVFSLQQEAMIRMKPVPGKK